MKLILLILTNYYHRSPDEVIGPMSLNEWLIGSYYLTHFSIKGLSFTSLHFTKHPNQ